MIKSILPFLNIYPRAIEEADKKVMKAFKDYGVPEKEINEMYDKLRDDFNIHITNSVIEDLFYEASELLEKNGTDSVTYTVDCSNSRFYVGEEEINE